MTSILFDYWWQRECARVQERAETAAVVRDVSPGRSSRRPSRDLLGPVEPGPGRVPAGALAFRRWVAGHRSMPVIAATVLGKRG